MTDAAATPPPRARWRVAFAALLVFAFCGFVVLGVWQLQRMAWKHDLIARVGGTPVAVFALGNTPYLNVGGVRKEFLVVHQGLPSSLYDASCDGTWLLEPHQRFYFP